MENLAQVDKEIHMKKVNLSFCLTIHDSFTLIDAMASLAKHHKGSRKGDLFLNLHNQIKDKIIKK